MTVIRNDNKNDNSSDSSIKQETNSNDNDYITSIQQFNNIYSIAYVLNSNNDIKQFIRDSYINDSDNAKQYYVYTYVDNDNLHIICGNHIDNILYHTILKYDDISNIKDSLNLTHINNIKQLIDILITAFNNRNNGLYILDNKQNILNLVLSIHNTVKLQAQISLSVLDDKIQVNNYIHNMLIHMIQSHNYNTATLLHNNNNDNISDKDNIINNLNNRIKQLEKQIEQLQHQQYINNNDNIFNSNNSSQSQSQSQSHSQSSSVYNSGGNGKKRTLDELQLNHSILNPNQKRRHRGQLKF